MADTVVAELQGTGHHQEPPEPQQSLNSNHNRTSTKSLFGTTLEQVDYDSLKNIEGEYIIEGDVIKTKERYSLPKRLHDLIPGREQLELSREKLNKQKQILDDVDKHLKSKTKSALTFKPVENTDHSCTSYSPSWLPHKDIEHSREINSIGLNARESYNRDKYGPKPLRHTYSLIGDPFATNMDFNSSKNTATPQARTIWSKGRHLPYELMKQRKTEENTSASLVTLPLNIRHKFGSRDCDFLLSDENLVRMTLEKQSSLDRSKRSSRKESLQHLPVDLTGNYESLGHLTRYCIGSGVTTDNKISNTKQDFNDSVHLRRVPNPDQFRYQRDELSTWAEHNVLRERMKKAWNEQHPLGGQK